MKTLQHKFVKNVPDELVEGIIYISGEYGTAIHKCVCGCGNEVITPFSPTDWELTYNGETVTLKPSIGNWNFECQSHYWIIKSKIINAEKWTSEKINDVRKIDKKNKKKFFKEAPLLSEESIPIEKHNLLTKWERIKNFFSVRLKS